ncbi:MAG: PRTRC system protein D [Sterolibacterium sp.]|jgi:plasmid segregation protein ParM
MKKMIVRAVDVGYGHVKYSLGLGANGEVLCDRFPSLSPPYTSHMYINASFMQQRNTFVVGIEDRQYEVGKEVMAAIDPNFEGTVMDLNFAISDAYRARLYGALNYIAQDIPDNFIDILILGLPLNTFTKYKNTLADQFTGPHTINSSGKKIEVRRCEIYPQPFGSYMKHISSAKAGTSYPVALVVDVGYNTFDWLVCHGKSTRQYGAAMRGMSSVINAMAKEVIKTIDSTATESSIMRRIDAALMTGSKFTMYGKPVKLDAAQKMGESVIRDAADKLKSALQDAADIDLIILTGGGAPFYRQAISQKFPNHNLILLDDSAMGNVRGFHMVGESLARSLSRAVSGVAA